MQRSPTKLVAVLIGRIQSGLARFIERHTLPAFANASAGVEIRLPRTLVKTSNMHIGRDVKLGPGSVLKCQTSYPGGWMRHPEGEHVQQSFDPVLTIGDRVTASGGLQVLAFESVVIEDDVMFANNVFVADATHAFGNADVPYKYQGVGQPRPIRIGHGSWIGQNVVILPGVQIGPQAIVGANSVVSRDVDARTLVAGAPARPIKRWDAGTSTWKRVDDEKHDASSS